MNHKTAIRNDGKRLYFFPSTQSVETYNGRIIPTSRVSSDAIVLDLNVVNAKDIGKVTRDSAKIIFENSSFNTGVGKIVKQPKIKGMRRNHIIATFIEKGSPGSGVVINMITTLGKRSMLFTKRIGAFDHSITDQELGETVLKAFAAADEIKD